MPAIIIYLVAAIALFGSGGGLGWKIATDHAKAQELAAVEAAEAKFQAEVDEANAAAQQYEEKARDAQAQTLSVTQDVDRAVAAASATYARACFDDAGMRAANAALAGKAVPAGGPGGAVPGPGAAGKPKKLDGASQAR
jgi:multidrug resistance efflux pump